VNRLTGEQAATVLAAARIAFGVGAYLAPAAAARAFGARPSRDPAVTFVIRTFAGRDVVLGVGLAGSVGRERDRWLVLGALTDTLDAVAALWAARRRQIPWVNGLAAALTASGAVALAARARRP
jgi:hypothetical protein